MSYSENIQASEQIFDKNWCESLFSTRSESSISGALSIQAILKEIGVGIQGQKVGLLYGLGDLSDNEVQQAQEIFGHELVDAYQSVRSIDELAKVIPRVEANQADEVLIYEENLRKMMITMVEDVQVVLIKLASQLHLMRSIKSWDAEIRRQHAAITQNIYAPLANRLGLWQLKWELEDWSFRYLNPKTYQNLAAILQEKRRDRESYIESLTTMVGSMLKQHDIEAQVYGRPKHLYSIWKKMQVKGLEFSDLWDVRAVRILVNSIEECFESLSVIHSTWTHYPSEYTDYISTPKSNGYRSIHTVINGPDNKSVEVQIRTHEMHQQSEFGLAAHWRYKENADHDSGIEDKILWLRQLLEWKNEVMAVQGVKPPDAEKQNIYVFTPKGTIVQLPKGATPIDFAYAIHTEVGHRTRGALVNNKMVPLNHKLASADQVQIHTVKSGSPSLDWLRPESGYVKTHRARSQISRWLKRVEYDQNVAEGRVLLEKELQKLHMEDLSYEKICQRTHFQKVDDLLAAIGAKDYKLSKALFPFKSQVQGDQDHKVETLDINTGKNAARSKVGSFRVQGVGNLLTHMANCCNPVPGDQIIGYITKGRGVTIHRAQCINILNLEQDLKPRLIEVDWGSQVNQSYTLGVDIVAYHRSKLLHDITEMLKSSNIDILKVNMDTDKEHVTRLQLKLDITSDHDIDSLLSRLRSIHNVFQVQRQ